MKYIPLGATNIQVSQFCLGTMTFGSQTSEAEGHAQIDASLEAGINFVDTAEAYPVNPMIAETAGRTEEIIGTWLAKSKRRDDIILATKVAGVGGPNRDGAPISVDGIREAVEGSLRRLQTDYVDLYQLHWPNRGGYMFRRNWTYDPSDQDKTATIGHMEEVLVELGRHVDAGRIRHVGVSNESAWGTAQWLSVAERIGAPRMQSVQNEYSLLARLYDTDMAELTHNEQMTLLAYSPLAAGFLTGKYSNGAVPDGSRMSLSPEMGGRLTDRVLGIAQMYVELAQRHDLHPVHMALAFCTQRPFLTAPIIGATTMEQLQIILEGADVVLTNEVLDELNTAHKAHPMPY